MSEARQDELDAVDPGWCPVWDTGWQRYVRLAQNHVQAGGTLPTAESGIVVQGEGLGRRVTARRFGWEQLLSVQQWIRENTSRSHRPVRTSGRGGAGLGGAQRPGGGLGRCRVRDGRRPGSRAGRGRSRRLSRRPGCGVRRCVYHGGSTPRRCRSRGVSVCLGSADWRSENSVRAVRLTFLFLSSRRRLRGIVPG